MQIFQENDVIIGNSGSSKSFTISASAKAFKVLSSNIYKNKIRAVVRELVCNAVDAHVLNSQTKPYEIKVPNLLDPRFIVRDFGPGLSHEDMIDLYTTYFASTKADRNDQIGALGLGSKSPFSYTSTFSVVSYFGGMVRVYQCMLSNGEPNIVKTHEEPFNDSDVCGIEVIVPVKPEDITRWEKEISYVMRPFPINSYKATGAFLEIDSLELYENYSKDWFGVKGHRNSNCNVYAIYGNIVYPLNDVPGLNTHWLSTKFENLYIHFNLGLLDIQPSREELSLDEKTVKNICDRINTLDEVEKTKDIEHLHTITNKRELARQLLKMSGSSYNALTNTMTTIQGKFISEWTKGFDLEKVLKILENCKTYQNDRGNARIRSPFQSNRSYRRFKISEYDVGKLFEYKQTKVFIVYDDAKNIRTTLEGLWLSSDTNHPEKDDYIITTKDETILNNIIEESKRLMEGDEVVVLKSSELEDIRKLVPGYGIKKKRDYVKRPNSPNAISYTYDKQNDMFIMENLYLVSDEIKDIEGPVIGMYRDDLRVLGANWCELQNKNLQDVKCMASYFKIDKFVVVRPVIFEKIQKNENVECLYRMFYKEYKQALLSVKPENYYFVGNTRFASKLKMYSEFEFLKNDMCGIETVEAKRLNVIYGWFESTRIFPHTESFNKLIAFCNKRYSKNINVAKEKYETKLRLFKTQHYAIYYTMNDTYSFEKWQIDSIINDLKKS